MLGLLSGVGCATFTGSASAAGCDRYASPAGSDSGSGTSANPYRSVVRLDGSLSPGQTGCLLAGTYGDTSTSSYLSNSGSAAGQITITPYPGATVTVVGMIDLAGSYTTLNGLNIDGSNTAYSSERSGTSCPYPVSTGLEIDGQNDILQYNNYYQSVASLRGNGLGIGWSGQANNTVIRYNRIHDVGGCDFYDHLIYLDSGNNVQIYDNWLWNDSHGWGIKLDPGPTNARIWSNVIDSAGSGFGFGNSSGDNPTAGNQVFQNVVLNSVGLSNPDIGWSQPGALVTSPGLLSSSTGNEVYNNDSYDNPGGIAELSGVSSSQLSVTNTISVNPGLVDTAAHDYAPVPGSPLAGWGLWNGGFPAITTPVANASPVAAPAVQAKPKPAQPPAVKKPRSKPHKAKKRKATKRKAKKRKQPQKRHKAKRRRRTARTIQRHKKARPRPRPAAARS
jgi:Right handed beta helix region